MATTTSSERTNTITKKPIPADLVAMSRDELLARIEQLFDKHPGIQVIECGRTDPHVCDDDLRTMIWDIEWCLKLRAE